MPFDPSQFRSALGAFVTGVTIVTTRAPDGTDVGLTANSFNSVSLDPPLVLWSLARNARSREAFTQAAGFAVHVLAIDQEELSKRFATRGEVKFAGLTLERGEGGVPLLQGCSARFECRTTFQYEGGDHIIFVGEVLSFTHCDKRPLALHAGRYAVTAHRSRPATPDNSSENDGGFNEDFLGYLLGRAHFQFYAKIRGHLIRHGLSDAEHYVLGVLGNGDGRSPAQIDAIIAYTGVRVTPTIVESLLARGLVELSDGVGGSRLWLTSSGRKMMIELIAVAKAAEADAQKYFDDDEIRALNQLLKQFISGTDPGVPSLWAR
jgi:3-hydroxy-9,10-secoandrosta-1,3,5(10)-triene-9,17-dione monooxygenase reductase component